MQIERHGTTRRYSDSVVHNGTVYLVEVPSNPEGDIAAQTANLLASVDTLLARKFHGPSTAPEFSAGKMDKRPGRG